METDRLAITIDEAARVSSVCRTALYAAVGRGELTIRKRGRRSLILTSELRRWLEQLPASGAQSAA